MDEIHTLHAELPAQMPRQLSIAATLTKTKDACTVPRTPPAAGQTTNWPLFCCTTERMRGSIAGCVACECETVPPEAGKNPKAEFHAEAPEGCSAVRWSE